MNIDWSKAPEEFPLWLEGLGEHAKHSGWYRRAGEVFEAALGGQFRAVREGQFFTVHRKPEWNGEGLPPVGTVCEYIHVSEWQKVEVFAVKLNYNGSHTALFTYENGCWASSDRASFFRPIRTPEQLAVEQMAEIISTYVADVAAAEALYDAGYRKFEIVEEDV